MRKRVIFLTSLFFTSLIFFSCAGIPKGGVRGRAFSKEKFIGDCFAKGSKLHWVVFKEFWLKSNSVSFGKNKSGGFFFEPPKGSIILTSQDVDFKNLGPRGLVKMIYLRFHKKRKEFLPFAVLDKDCLLRIKDKIPEHSKPERDVFLGLLMNGYLVFLRPLFEKGLGDKGEGYPLLFPFVFQGMQYSKLDYRKLFPLAMTE